MLFTIPYCLYLCLYISSPAIQSPLAASHGQLSSSPLAPEPSSGPSLAFPAQVNYHGVLRASGLASARSASGVVGTTRSSVPVRYDSNCSWWQWLPLVGWKLILLRHRVELCFSARGNSRLFFPIRRYAPDLLGCCVIPSRPPFRNATGLACLQMRNFDWGDSLWENVLTLHPRGGSRHRQSCQKREAVVWPAERFDAHDDGSSLPRLRYRPPGTIIAPLHHSKQLPQILARWAPWHSVTTRSATSTAHACLPAATSKAFTPPSGSRTAPMKWSR